MLVLQLFFLCCSAISLQYLSLVNANKGSNNEIEDTDYLDEDPNTSGLTDEDKGDIYNPMNGVFENITKDLTLITWKHAVNSLAKLNAALNSSAMMLEADVIFGTLIGDPSGKKMPIMGHPPLTESDLSLKMFIEKTNEGNKGIKLDFKSDDAFLKAVPVIQDHYSPESATPLWLNADILPGPVNPVATPVSADVFLGASTSDFPNDMLSVGWTTSYVPGGRYTEEHTDAMASALNRNNVQKAVTFPVRAVYAAESLEVLEHLVSTSPAGSSLTIWMSDDTDPVNVSKLRKLIESIGKDKIFLDVPDFIRHRLNNIETGIPPSSREGLFSFSVTTIIAAVAFVIVAIILILVLMKKQLKSRPGY